MKNFIIYTSTLLFLITFSGCGSGTNCGDIDAANMLPGDSDFESIIEDFNKTFYKNNLSNEFVDATNVYVDLSDGITKYALGNTNNKNLLEQFFFTVQNQENLNYYELSNNQVQKYEGTQALSYFISNGHKDDNGKLKMGAPIDKAFNDIASKNELGIVITDGELYDSVAKEVSMNPWASDAFKSWFSSGGKLNILYTDFTEKNSGKSYNKHMYLIIFIPNGYDGNLVESLTTDFNDNNIVFNSMKFNTDVSKLHTREYPDSQTPGTLALNEFGSISGYFSESNFEYFDLEEIADFHTEEGGVVYYTRDQLNDNGKPINKPLLEKLYLDLESIENYSVDNIKIKISNVSDDFQRFKRNYYAKLNKPEVLVSLSGKDSLSEQNHLVFDECLTLIDGLEPYDLYEKVKSDTSDDFVNMLNPDFTYNEDDLNSKEIRDFIFLDQEAGSNNEKNLQNYEVVLKFDKKFNEDNLGFFSERNNVVKVDVFVEKDDFSLKSNTVNRKALTWDKIDDSGVDQTLYTSLLNVLKNNKPNSTLYTYYIKFGPFNQ